MKIQTIIPISALLILSSTQCMELINPKINTNSNQATLKLDDSLIEKFVKMSKQNKSNPLLFSQRIKRLNLLRQLLNSNAEITFSNKDDDTKFWFNKDEKIVTDILYEKFLSFLSYKSNKNTIKINHIPFSDQQKTFNVTMQYNTSLLHISSEQSLPRNTQTTLTKFMNEYWPKNKIEKIKYNLSENPQQPDQSLVHNQETPNIEDMLIQLTEEDSTTLKALPYNTQQLLINILLDQDNPFLHDKSDSLIASK
jgi:hypothetical protein